ncbi:MAG TPA: hypothetical protein VF582_01990 [Allosphingosinicella sp.]|jgi:hypothetical protein
MDQQTGYDSGGTAGGKCGCIAAALVGLALLSILTLTFMGDCLPGDNCHEGGRKRFFVGLLIIGIVSSAVGLGTRWLIQRFVEWNHKPREMTPQEAAELLRKCIDGTAKYGEIDYFISVDIVDPVLDDVKDEVGMLYGPGWDDEETRARLREQLRRVEDLITTERR